VAVIGLVNPAQGHSEGLTTNVWLLVAGFGLVFGAAYYLLELSLSYYAGFVLPHRFHLSTQTVMGWIAIRSKA